MTAVTAARDEMEDPLDAMESGIREVTAIGRSDCE
jgi:hypothetical protein